MNKLSSSGFFEKFMNFITPTKATWNGHNSSGWKADIIKVNGFDERMQYGGQDRELGERLINLGIKPIQLRYSAIVVHLDHKRGYKTQESIDKNKAIRKATKTEKSIFTPYGVVTKNEG
jgi:GT2 family glycosyltransferase